MGVHELTTWLKERGVDYSMAIEKTDLEILARESAKQV